MENEVYFGPRSSKNPKNLSLGVSQRIGDPLVLKTTQADLDAQMKSHKGTSSSLLKERNSNPRALVRHEENKGGRTMEENKSFVRKYSL